MSKVNLTIPYPYNPGEYRVSKRIIGPRGGKKWQVVASMPATGGTLQTDLEPGVYKETWWSNNWPTSKQFVVTDDGEIFEEPS